YPGTYAEFLWSKEHQEAPRPAAEPVKPPRPSAPTPKAQTAAPKAAAGPGNAESREERKRAEAERRRRSRAAEALQKRISDLESRIADREAQVKQLEETMASPGFFSDTETAKPVTDRHQALMWEVGDLIAQWEALQEHSDDQRSET